MVVGKTLPTEFISSVEPIFTGDAKYLACNRPGVSPPSLGALSAMTDTLENLPSEQLSLFINLDRERYLLAVSHLSFSSIFSPKSLFITTFSTLGKK